MILRKIKQALKPFYAPTVNQVTHMLFGPKRYSNLFSALKKTKASKIMEVGTWSGARAIKLISLAKSFHPADQIEYYGFDLFEGMTDESFVHEISKRPPTQAEVQHALEQTGAEITLFKGDTLKTLPDNTPSLPKMDLIFIDGGHSLDTIANDWKYSEQLMHERTIVVFDDYWLNRADGGCKSLIDSLDRNVYIVNLSKQTDRFVNESFGLLEIKFAIVSKKI
ncbi:MAG: class I SAM-dependent methyltransferase [Patescibacteria group bacterium]